MIASIFHDGSGLGNQLHRYVMARVLASDLGVDFGMLQSEKFKGTFINLDMGKSLPQPRFLDNGTTPLLVPPLNKWLKYVFFEKQKRTEWKGERVDIRGYDKDIKDIKDETFIDGEFQAERYFEHRKSDIREWLKTEPIDLPDDLCVINFRGGEYKYFPNLYLTKEYWDKAILKMRKINPEMRFIVVSDDVAEACVVFPEFNIWHDPKIGLDWRYIRYAKYLILSNSSFAILPALLNENLKKVIAPKYWARRNTKIWALPQNKYKGWDYI